MTPAWIYSKKKNEVSWANSEAKSMYFKSQMLKSKKIDENHTMDIYGKVEDEHCTVHLVGPRKLLLSNIITDLSVDSEDDNVRLVITPVIISNTPSMLFQQVSLNKITFGETLEVSPQDTPLDIVIRMLDLLSSGVPVTSIHAKLIKNVLMEDFNMKKPVFFSKSFMKAFPGNFKRQNFREMLQMPQTSSFDESRKIFNKIERKELPKYRSRPNSVEQDKLICKYFKKCEITPLDNIFHCNIFNAFYFDKICNGNIMSKLAFKIFEDTKLIKKLSLDHEILFRFLVKVENEYYKCRPYHNNLHGASVMHSIHVIMTKYGVIDILDKYDDYQKSIIMLATYIAAYIHDYRHQGLSNNCLVEILSPLAILYNDISPQEQSHCASAFQLMTQDEYNFFKHFDKETIKKFRGFVISLVLLTDMQEHFSIMTKFKNSSNKDELITLQMALKCADMGHLTYPFDLHIEWVKRLEEEMFQQGDFEEANGIPKSPLCDRSEEGITSSQVDFFDFVALNMFKEFTSKFPLAKPLYTQIRINYTKWQEKMENKVRIGKT